MGIILIFKKNIKCFLPSVLILILLLSSCGINNTSNINNGSDSTTGTTQNITEANSQLTDFLNSVKTLYVPRENIEWFVFEEKRGTKEDELIREDVIKKVLEIKGENIYKDIKIPMYVGDFDNDGTDEIAYTVTYVEEDGYENQMQWVNFVRIADNKLNEIGGYTTKISHGYKISGGPLADESSGLIRNDKNEVIAFIIHGVVAFDMDDYINVDPITH